MTLLQMSQAGAVMIVLITLLRALTINHLPKRTFTLLWGLVLCRLLLPLAIPFRYNASAFVHKSPAPAITPTTQPTEPFLPLAVTEPTIAPVAGSALDWLQLLWLSVAIALALLVVLTHLHYRRLYRTALPVTSPDIQNWLSTHQLRRTITIRRLDRISSPLTYGLLRPVIILPQTTDWQNSRQLEHILTHEFIHIKRWDVAYKWLLAAAVCLHWFNPLVWLMLIQANRDLELACDEAVLRLLGDNTGYAMTLLTLEESKNRPLSLVSRFSSHSLKERITAIMTYKPASLLAMAMAAVLIIAIAIGFNTTKPTVPVLDKLTPQLEQCLTEWADALAHRDGRKRFALMSTAMQQRFIAQQEADGYQWSEELQDFIDPSASDSYVWNIGGSSPWVEDFSYQLDSDTHLVTINYRTMTSEPQEYIRQEVLTCIQEDGDWKVDSCIETISDLTPENYTRALHIQQSLDEGHQPWRKNPEEVALTFLHEYLRLAEVTPEVPWDAAMQAITYRQADGQLITLQLYQPIIQNNGFWAIRAYEIADQHYNIANLLAPYN